MSIGVISRARKFGNYIVNIFAPDLYRQSAAWKHSYKIILCQIEYSDRIPTDHSPLNKLF